jgi:hypothetical protein
MANSKQAKEAREAQAKGVQEGTAREVKGTAREVKDTAREALIKAPQMEATPTQLRMEGRQLPRAVRRG